MIRPLLIIAVAGVTPGIIGFLAGAYIGAVYPQMFPLIAPHRIAGAVAMLATQVWLIGMGLALIAIAGFYEIKERWGQ